MGGFECTPENLSSRFRQVYSAVRCSRRGDSHLRCEEVPTTHSAHHHGSEAARYHPVGTLFPSSLPAGNNPVRRRRFFSTASRRSSPARHCQICKMPLSVCWIGGGSGAIFTFAHAVIRTVGGHLKHDPNTDEFPLAKKKARSYIMAEKPLYT
jgi:hypothetical protein